MPRRDRQHRPTAGKSRGRPATGSRAGSSPEPAAPVLNGSVPPRPEPWQALAILWLLPPALTLLQLAWIQAGQGQIRMEELAESVRNVHWFEHRKVYDGTSSNVGWYGLQMLFYRVAGFGLHHARYLRLGLHLGSLICLALLLRRTLGPRRAWLPLLALGLSPTLMYFNTLQTSYGVDLQVGPICLLLLFSVGFGPGAAGLLRSAGLFAVAMCACMAYPTFLFYIPPLVLAYVLRARAASRAGQGGAWRAHGVAAATGFALPLAAALLYVESPGRLLWDPATGTGLFRGGGKLSLDPARVLGALEACLGDLLSQGRSYYFPLPRPDLSGPLGWLCLLLLALGVGLLLRGRKSPGDPAGSRSRAGLHQAALLALLLLALGLLLPALTARSYPGIRRCTPVIFALYLLFGLSWWGLTERGVRGPGRRWLLTGLFVLLPAHHLLALPENLRSLGTLSPYREETWFTLRGDPAASLEFLVQATGQRRLPLKCLGPDDRPIPCRYGEVWSAIDGYRLWNGLERTPVYAFDWRRGRGDIPLRFELWERYYFPH